MTMLGDGTDNAPDPSRALNAVRSPPRRAPSLAELTRDGLCSNRICSVTSKVRRLALWSNGFRHPLSASRLARYTTASRAKTAYRGRLRLLADATIAGWLRFRCSSSTSLGRSQLAMTVQFGRWKDHHCTACHFRTPMAGERCDQMRCAHSEVTARLRVTICVGRSPSSTRRCGSSRSQMRRSSGSSYTPSVLRAPGTAGNSNIESVQRERLPNASPHAASAWRPMYHT